MGWTMSTTDTRSAPRLGPFCCLYEAAQSLSVASARARASHSALTFRL